MHSAQSQKLDCLVTGLDNIVDLSHKAARLGNPDSTIQLSAPSKPSILPLPVPFPLQAGSLGNPDSIVKFYVLCV